MNAALEPVDDVVKSVVATNGPIDPAVEYLGKFEGKWLGVPMTRGTLLLGCCSRFDLMKEHAGIDVQALYPGRQAAQRRKLDLGRLPGGRRKVPEGRLCLRPAARLHHRHQPVGRRLVPGLWRGSHGCQGQRHGEVGRRPPGARVRQEARRVLSAGRAVVGRCVEQQVAALRQGGADLQPAERLGRRPSATRPRSRRSAGRTASRRGRRAASIRSCRVSTASGASRRTSRRPRACSSFSRSVRMPSGRSRQARATTSRRTRSSTTSRPGTRRDRPRARSRTIRSRAATRWPEWSARRRRR